MNVRGLPFRTKSLHFFFFVNYFSEYRAIVSADFRDISVCTRTRNNDKRTVSRVETSVSPFASASYKLPRRMQLNTIREKKTPTTITPRVLNTETCRNIRLRYAQQMKNRRNIKRRYPSSSPYTDDD